MAQKINVNIRKPYNDAPLHAGEVLVPQLVDDRAYAIAIGANPENFKTWTTAGVSYTVMFVPVPAEQEAISVKAFQAALKELLDAKLGPNRFSRCLIPQPDGSLKLCPKIKGDNHAPCALCPDKGKYAKEDKSTVSLESLDDENYAPMETAPSAESEALEKATFDDLLAYLKEINPVLADVVMLGFQGFEKKDIIKQLPVKSSQAYDLYAKAERLTREFLAQ